MGCFSFFSQKCIEAIDGTHVDTNVTGENKVPCQDYKSNTSQNATSHIAWVWII